jgi:beta-galactosidase/beta-glucuronidase
LPEPTRKRCRHVVTESGRTLAVAEALRSGRPEECGRMMMLSHAKLWSPDSPHLYDLKFRLFQDDELLDEVASYTRMRDVELLDRKV